MATEKRLKQREAVKESILCAARAIVLKEGWQAVSIRKIAEVIGYSLPVVYTHYENKDAILEEFVKLGFNELNAVILAAKNQFVKPEQQLAAMADAYFEFARTSKEYYQMMFGLGMPSCERINQISAIANFSTTIMTTLQSLLNKAQTGEKIVLKFHNFWSILHGLTSINIANLTATPAHVQQLILQDAVQGFIKNINN
jgi:AcrR family transcriptional regulator